MDWSDWISLCSALIALVALSFSLVGYFKYDRPIKSIQKEKLLQEEKERKMADFEIKYESTVLSERLRIKNTSKVTAKNIEIEIRSKKTIAFKDGSKTHIISQLEPTQKTGYLLLEGDCPYSLKLKLRWDDESGERVEKNYYVDKG